MTEYVLREAAAADARTIAEYRSLMFEAMGWLHPGEGPALVEAMQRYVERELPAGAVRAWIVEADGQPVAGGLLVLQATAPAPGFLAEEPVGLIQNIWTEPSHRRRGLAGQLVRAMLDWCRANGVHRLFLNATEDGRGIYTALGFRPSTTAMTLTLD
ncbi:MAG: GNAT family N-acetyltransferase [Chloroflexota bacterium]